jgi:hypothetical protein
MHSLNITLALGITFIFPFTVLAANLEGRVFPIVIDSEGGAVHSYVLQKKDGQVVRLENIGDAFRKQLEGIRPGTQISASGKDLKSYFQVQKLNLPKSNLKTAYFDNTIQAGERKILFVPLYLDGDTATQACTQAQTQAHLNPTGDVTTFYNTNLKGRVTYSTTWFSAVAVPRIIDG